MDNDDILVGRPLSRRDAVRLLAVAGAAVAGCSRAKLAATDTANGVVALNAGDSLANMPACIAKPELTVGPYFLDKQLDRSDIRAEPTTGALKAGVPLALAFNVSRIDAGGCQPLPNAIVDLWQCDALGIYSGFNDRMVGFDTTGQTFLRGFQRTDNAGVARFTTVYPGWYQGRTVHIHFKIRTESAPSQAYEFTSQLFFPESVTDQVHAQAPYASKGQRDLKNAQDGIYRRAGDTLLLSPTRTADGYAATFAVGLDLSDARVGRPDRMGRPGGPGGPPPPQRPPAA
jgi:protocatechuate 3,4-dioxygenase beta subunit